MGNPEIINSPRHLDSLRIVVHPMFQSPLKPYFSDYMESQRLMGEAIIERFTPQASGELLLFMPNVANLKGLRGDIRRQRESKGINPEWQIWPDLFRRLKKASEFPSNVRLVEI